MITTQQHDELITRALELARSSDDANKLARMVEVLVARCLAAENVVTSADTYTMGPAKTCELDSEGYWELRGKVLNWRAVRDTGNGNESLLAPLTPNQAAPK